MKAGAPTIAARDPSIAIDRRSRSAVRRARLRNAWTGADVDGPIAKRLCKAALRLAGRCIAVEGLLMLTAVLCALAGFPAVLTAFFVALVGLVANLWLAVRTLGPLCLKLWKGVRA